METIQTATYFLSDLVGKTFALDCETNGEDIRDGRGYTTGIAIAFKDGDTIRSHYFPFRHTMGGNLPREVLIDIQAALNAAPSVVFHNAKFDLVALKTIGLNYSGKFHDTMLMCHLINENRPFQKSLEACAAHYLGPGNHKAMTPELQKFIDNFGWANVPVELMWPYATMDTELTLRLAAKIWPLFVEEGLEAYWEHKQKLLRVLVEMEGRGVRIDPELCRDMIVQGEHRMGEIKAALGGYSPTSPKDLQVLLLEKLGLPVVKRSEKTGKPSFDKYAMEEYEQILSRTGSETAQLILEYRGWQKSVSSNYRAYLELVSPDGRLRPNYKMHGTKTGRLSCEKPNLQQIPRSSDKPWNGRMKKAFVAAEGYSLWEADYSQLELRLSAAYAGEESLIRVFQEGRDIFTEMAATLGMDRNDTKTFVYSTQYGAGIRRIKNVFGVTEGRAKEIRQNYFNAYPKVKRLSDRAQAKALSHGKVQLWTKRFRHFMNPEKESHKALNSVIQGGGADIVEHTMVRLFEEIDQPSVGECRMLLQVHDSVVFEIKNGREDYYLPKIKAVMEDVRPDFGVPFAVDVHPWGE